LDASPKYVHHFPFIVTAAQRHFLTQDVDILVTSPRSEDFDAEEIKQAIVDADSRYYLRPSKQPGATYKVLFCRLPGWRSNWRHVKVDILLPVRPRLWVPRVLSRDTYVFNGIMVTPLFDLLVIKMQGWRDHRASRRADFRAKVEADISDIRALLDQGLVQEMSYQDEKRHHTQGFMARAHRLALSFIEMCGERTKFQALGFLV